MNIRGLLPNIHGCADETRLLVLGGANPQPAACRNFGIHPNWLGHQAARQIAKSVCRGIRPAACFVRYPDATRSSRTSRNFGCTFQRFMAGMAAHDQSQRRPRSSAGGTAPQPRRSAAWTASVWQDHAGLNIRSRRVPQLFRSRRPAKSGAAARSGYRIATAARPCRHR